MRPSNYNYLKRMWTRNYPKRGSGIISNIVLFPFKLCIFIVIVVIMTGLYIVYGAILFLLKFILEFSKVFFKFFCELIIGIFKIVKNRFFQK